MKHRKLTVLIGLFMATSVAVHYQPADSAGGGKTAKLTDFFQQVDNHKTAGTIELDEAVYRFLDLDDYIFTSYLSAEGPVNLYIGFYHTAAKISAAHSPLACFPSQGWTIDQPTTRRLDVDEHTINYAAALASLQEREELILYWYQSHHITTARAHINKINTIYNKLRRNEEQHAFVRISVPVIDADYDRAHQAGTAFMKAIYPRFLEYING